jgi:hypothetical protein
VGEKPFGRIDFPGDRPDAAPMDRGRWEPFTVYLEGDVVEGRKRSGSSGVKVDAQWGNRQPRQAQTRMDSGLERFARSS